MTNLKLDTLPKLEGYDLDTTSGCRAAYSAARRYVVGVSYSGSSSYPTNMAFDNAVREMMAMAGIENPTARDWVKFAHKLTWHCARCGGTGQYVTMVLNGRPTGPGGQCYRCNGKGHQNAQDAHRNYWHAMKRPLYM